MLKSAVKKLLGLSTFSNETSDDSIVASSPPTLTQKKYEVFLSFRGFDTRNNFTSHLDSALRRKHIEVYMDERQDRGVEISPALIKAIEGSRLAVVVFSLNYADSWWCLSELVHILKCRKRDGMFVIPVFFHVEPSDVRKQKGDFGNALSRIKKPDKATLQEWRDALTEAANLSGWDSAKFRPEADLVEIIVGDVIRNLSGQPTVDFTGLTGFPQRLKVAESMLEIGSPDVRIIGIGGMGGIGKTTLAQTVYRRISFQFDAYCFLENVRDEWKESRGARYLQNKLMSELFPEENVQADNIYRPFYKTRLQRKKVLIVLDDVDDSSQLKVIAGGHDWYGAGSRIILTSRDDRALAGSDVKFKVTELSTEEALELFQSEAFETNPLTKDQIKLSEEVVLQYSKTDFNPLALIRLASTLKTQSFERWRGILERREKLDETVQRVLTQSYYGLIEDNQHIFLDIACFFNRESRDFAERILDGCGFSGNEGIEDLINKSLLNIVGFNRLWMQHLNEAMGREIVRIESVTEPGERSRLWNPVDLGHVFNNKSETNKIQGISLDMFRMDPVKVSTKVFLKMYNLRVLKFHNHSGKCMLMFPDQEQLHSLPEKLRYLCWEGYPFIYLPSHFTGLNLVELKMQYSNLEKLWEGVQPQNLNNLRVLDLSFSNKLNEIPNLSRATNVERVCLKGCGLVREVPQYFEVLERLNILNLKNCSSLETVSALPRNIVDVNLSHCVSLKNLPEYIPTLNLLDRLKLNGCSSFDYDKNREIYEFVKDRVKRGPM